MNLPDAYIKMVLALPDEFFKDWQWKEGDQFILEYNSPYNMKVHCIGDAVVYRSKVYDIEITSDDIRSQLDDARPIPNQEQLQRIAIEAETASHPWHPSNDFDISRLFVARVIEGDLVEDIENKTLKEMWLEFTANIVLHNRWNGEAWVDDDE